MFARFSVHWSFFVIASCFTLSGCSFLSTLESTPGEQTVTENVSADTDHKSTEETVTAEPVVETQEKQPQAPHKEPSSLQRNFFQEGINRAESAVAIGQSAQSPDDWNLVAGRWKQAVSLMQQVPSSDPNHAVAQQKVQEYQKNASQADRKAAGEVSSSASTTTANTSQPNGLVARIPILERMGGTPVVSVTLTGNGGKQSFSMLFDTGATLTLITPEMAQSVGVLVVDEVTVTVADGRRVQMPIGYVDTLEVGGLVVRDLYVGIGGDVGLLGQDVYGPYGISAGGSSINLYE